MPYTNNLIQRSLDWAFDDAAVTRPSEWFVGLYTTAPTAAGNDGVEVSGAGYARKAVAFSRTANVMDNDDIVVFGPAEENWGEVQAFAIFDAIAGTMVAFSTLVTPRTINNGDRGEFAAGALTVTIT
jgi:hypothetical protein